MVFEGTVKKGDLINCPMADGSLRTLTVKAIDSIAPSKSPIQEKYPIALIVECIKPAEAAIGKELYTVAESRETPASGSKAGTPKEPAQNRKVS
jgi:hypothetical protein